MEVSRSAVTGFYGHQFCDTSRSRHSDMPSPGADQSNQHILSQPDGFFGPHPPSTVRTSAANASTASYTRDPRNPEPSLYVYYYYIFELLPFIHSTTDHFL